MNILIDKAIRVAYPSVVTISMLDGVTTAYDDKGNEVSLDQAVIAKEIVILEEQNKISSCKKTASELLYETDWTTIPDVANSENSPYLKNQAEFIAWRSQIRALAVNPVVDPVFPPKPTEIWG